MVKLDYADDASSPAVDLLVTKLLINSTVSDAYKGARFCSVDLKDFFLCSTMKEPECMCIHSKYFYRIFVQHTISNRSLSLVDMSM